MHKRTLVSNLSEINNAIIKIRNYKEGYVTNFFMDECRHQSWINNGIMYAFYSSKVVLLFKKAIDYCNVYYIATNLSELISVIEDVHTDYIDEKWYIEIIGRNSQCVPVLDKLYSIGYSEYNCLQRMVRTTNDFKDYNTDDVIYAKNDDISEIDRYLHLYFNERIEQLPLIDELKQLVNDGCIIKCEENNHLIGFLIFEMNASTIHLRYWFTHPEYRNRKVGAKLLNRFFKIGKNTKRQILWVLKDNENALRRYLHYGFITEDMNDYIMTK